MEKDDIIVMLIIIAAFVMAMLLYQGCSVVNVQVATGSPAIIDDPVQENTIQYKKERK